ncbi:MAG: hypothetical protein RL141_1128 [Candidatus Parcubacteria bacterium]|jgi:uncharacterized membrane protein YqgA involved in biofilm formation
MQKNTKPTSYWIIPAFEIGLFIWYSLDIEMTRAFNLEHRQDTAFIVMVGWIMGVLILIESHLRKLVHQGNRRENREELAGAQRESSVTNTNPGKRL